MRKFLSTLSILNLFLPFFQIANAESYKFLDGQGRANELMIYGISSKGTSTLLNTYYGSDELLLFDWADGHVDEYRGKIYVDASEYSDIEGTNKTDSYLLEYDFIENTFTKKENLPEDLLLYPIGVKNMINEKSDGSIHIGENSAVFKEENGKEKFWAQDSNGKSIPIDITNGSKLLINGRDVEQSINNVGALSAALTGLPTVPTDTTLACSLGTGTHGGDFAFSGGCASKVNEKLSFNYAASMTMPGQDYAGKFEDKFSARAGFVWKLGKSTKKTKISINQKKEIDLKISKLENDNEQLKHENQKIISKYIQLENKNNEIISQNTKLLTRLKKLENIAFELHKNDELRLSKGL